MDKISGIIKASPRVTAVDIKESSPVRPGTPGFGRVESAAALKEPSNLGATTASKSAGLQMEAMDWRAKDSQHAALANELSEKFFLRGRPEASASEGVAQEPGNLTGPSTASQLSMREVASKPTGFKGDLRSDDFQAVARGLKSSGFGAEEEGVMESAAALHQPEGLYPKGSFLDRTA